MQQGAGTHLNVLGRNLGSCIFGAVLFCRGGLQQVVPSVNMGQLKGNLFAAAFDVVKGANLHSLTGEGKIMHY